MKKAKSNKKNKQKGASMIEKKKIDCTCPDCANGVHDPNCRCGCNDAKENKCECEDCKCDETENCGCGGHKHENDECDCETCDSVSYDLQLLEEDRAKYLDLYQRTMADFDNYRKRNREAVFKATEDGVAVAVKVLLPSIDALDKAIEMAENTEMKQGLLNIKNDMLRSLNDLGVTEIEAEGADFDPNLHEAVHAEENSKTPGKVLEVYQKGYKLGERIIRYSVVNVGK